MSIEDELVAIRLDANAAALPDVADVGRYALVDDGAAGRTETWTPDGTMQVRLGMIRARQPIDEGGAVLQSILDAVHVTYPDSETLAEKDRLAVAGLTYEIQVLLDVGSWSILNEAYAIKIL